MAATSEIRKGVVIKSNGDLFVVVEFQHINPGKGAAFVRTRMKSLATGKVMENTYKTSESVDIVQVQFQTMQYLYKAGENFAFMDTSSYEQIEMSGDLIGDEAKYLKEGVECIIGLYEGRAVSIQIPKKIQYKVVEAPPAVRGDSASGNVTKEIVLDNGLHIYAPIFIKEGEEILVNTETGEYSARASKE
ncbi:MAG: Translation elongation factor P [Candidatus Magasanikbacteria bacterium GW2011_GWC2_34_16]|uniref:Elongation factor P n=2 Tax=Candidatus Magasanikiibacteriota TaxID=1752731 RepID=A0A0G0HRC0_9BACT|nr:MAG: Translation elongation factor P [Candidatus Magasanikbacteria bacterium GW2011_GWC2_34_16]KKQ41140.1 MAG: Translation elongation factor P [Candidatus Magasanikbacteria bacterium GW2011_GWA2_37_8]